jgi:hypothetical protein
MKRRNFIAALFAPLVARFKPKKYDLASSIDSGTANLTTAQLWSMAETNAADYCSVNGQNIFPVVEQSGGIQYIAIVAMSPEKRKDPAGV